MPDPIKINKKLGRIIEQVANELDPTWSEEQVENYIQMKLDESKVTGASKEYAVEKIYGIFSVINDRNQTIETMMPWPAIWVWKGQMKELTNKEIKSIKEGGDLF